MIPLSVRQYLQDNRQQHLAKLLELLCIPSIANRDDGACERASAWLKGHLAGLGMSVQILTEGSKPCVLAKARVSDDLPTVLIYGHYDVQPPDPLEEWTSPPFEPAVRQGRIYARGADDDKGQVFAHLMAVEAYLRSGQGLPVNLTLLIEGEEECGSPTLERLVAAHAGELSADAVVISDSEFFAPGVPSITYALRGVSHFEVTLREADHDVHSGLHGGALRNPIHALADMVSAMHDTDGRIAIDGFYDGVQGPLAEERQAWGKLPLDEKAYAASLGVTELSGGEKAYSLLERLWSRPTLDANGIFGGYTGPGGKTVIPAKAAVKVSIRLVAGQDPPKVIEAIRRFVREHTPPGMTSTFEVGSMNSPVMLRTDTPAMEAARSALSEAFEAPVAMIRCGASVPVTEMFQRLLGLDAVMMGLGLPDDRLHSPNEKFDLDQLYRGSQACAALLWNLRQMPRAR